jgi:hypothetical protein
MVVVYVKTRQTGSEWVRESFVDPRHYSKWRAIMGKDLLAVRPVRKGVVSPRV